MPLPIYEDSPPPLKYLDPDMSPRDLTLIVAATNKMGIGRNGTLPWTGLKKEMAFFKRVTKRADPTSMNVVIMGRKTWDSIPPRFRPLENRFNIVLTRDTESQSSDPPVGYARAESLLSALHSVSATRLDRRAFVIGGAQIYKEALERPETKRILLTRVLSDFECDVFFPVRLGEDGTGDGWERKTKEELDRWVGERLPEGVQEENGTKYVFEMWERT